MPDMDENPSVKEVEEHVGEFDKETGFCPTPSQDRVEDNLGDTHQVGCQDDHQAGDEAFGSQVGVRGEDSKDFLVERKVEDHDKGDAERHQEDAFPDHGPDFTGPVLTAKEGSEGGRGGCETPSRDEEKHVHAPGDVGDRQGMLSQTFDKEEEKEIVGKGKEILDHDRVGETQKASYQSGMERETGKDRIGFPDTGKPGQHDIAKQTATFGNDRGPSGSCHFQAGEAPNPEDQGVIEQDVDPAHDQSGNRNVAGPGDAHVKRVESHAGECQREAENPGIEVFQHGMGCLFRIHHQPDQVFPEDLPET